MNRLASLEAVATGLAAGVAGTGCMTARHEVAAKLKSASRDDHVPAGQEAPRPDGLYDPPWKTSPHELALDLSYQVVCGTGVARGCRLLSRD